jgi:hypothetical protein
MRTRPLGLAACHRPGSRRLARGLLGRLGVAQERARAAGDCLAGGSEREAARGAVEKLRAEPLLQPGDGLGDGRLGEGQRLGGGGEGSKLRHFREDRPRFEIG